MVYNNINDISEKIKERMEFAIREKVSNHILTGEKLIL